MSKRNKTHNGRDRSGHFKVRQADVEELRTDPEGADFIQDDVRLAGAVEDVGAGAGQRGKRIGELVDTNRANVERLVKPSGKPGKPRRRA